MAGLIELTDAERSYIVQMVATKKSFPSLLVGYLPYLGPVVMFGAYGVVISDLTAVALSFLCLIGLNLWWIHGQSEAAILFQAICVKIRAAVGKPPQRVAPPPESDDDPRPADGAEQP